MSAATTFTLRDLNRQSAKVLAAVRKFGSAEVRTRSGEVFMLAPKTKTKSKSAGKSRADLAAEFRAKCDSRLKKMKELGYVPPTAAEFDNERFNRIIAGEE